MPEFLRSAGSGCALRNGYRFSLIGDEIAYSKSPAIFNAIFKHLSVPGQFDLASVKPNQLHSTLRQMVLDCYQGFSVTIPYKQTIIGEIDDVDPVARIVGAVNCVAVVERHLLGFNTDCCGFAYPFASKKQKTIGETALICGTGGSARSVVHSLYTDFGIRRVTMYSRSEEKLKSCVGHLKSQYEKGMFDGRTSQDERESISEKFDIVVNCTPAGGPLLPDDSPFGDNFPCTPGGIYYDLNYNLPNKLVEMARDQGLTVIDGRLMLVAQAVKAFQIWTDLEVPVEPIYQSVFGCESQGA